MAGNQRVRNEGWQLNEKKREKKRKFHNIITFGRIKSKAGYTATEVACGWAGAIFEVTRPFGQEQ